jgi:hypothetical protein
VRAGDKISERDDGVIIRAEIAPRKWLALFNPVDRQDGDALEIRFARLGIINKALFLDHIEEVELVVNGDPPVDAPVYISQVKVEGRVARVGRH